MKTRLYLLLFIALGFSSCEVAPKKINYGHEGCAYCKMTIVDRQHASQLVTSKGKTYNFDAIECMINFKNENKDKDFKLYMVNDFQNPGELIDASLATFLISEEISSPMGANLSAFQEQSIASETLKNYGGKLYTWNEIFPLITSN